MRMGCAACDCIVEQGERAVLCGQSDCCCTHVPAAPHAKQLG